MSRTRAHIEGDLAAATRQVEKLQAELAETQPNETTIRSWNCRLPIKFFLSGVSLAGGPTFQVEGSPRNHEYTSADAATLRDWLNYHFPKENA